MGKGFDISKFAETLRVSDSDTTGQEQIEYIDIADLDNDPNNFYALTGLDELAANIELLGLQQPIRVRPSPDHRGRYVIVSGHRRRAAIARLVESGRQDLSRIPCIVETPAASPALQELRLIYANSDTRKLSDAEISRQAERVEMLLYQLKEEGMEFPGRMRDQVAAACQISAPKLARLKVIREKLIPEYMGLFETNHLPEQTAYALARFPPDFQQRLARVLDKLPSGSTAEDILKKYNSGCRWEPNMTCPDGKPCKRGDAFLRRDCESSFLQGGFCGAEVCCLNCNEAKAAYSPCERMCSKAKAQRREKKLEKDAEKLKADQKREWPYQLRTQKNARRLLRAIDASGVADDVSIKWDYRVVAVNKVRQWAAGEFDDLEPWYSAQLEPGECRYAAQLAVQLHCSADFLVGLTDELCPIAAPERAEGQLMIWGWMPGGTVPFEPCDAVADFAINDDGFPTETVRMVCRFNGKQFVYSNAARQAVDLEIEAEVVRWMALPPVM